MIRPLLTSAAALAFAAGLGACEKTLEPPLDRGVCYHLAFNDKGEAHFNVVAENMPNLENCAAQLEGMRIRFARMGSYQNEVMGAYQGAFIFVERQGVFTAQKFKATRYLALVRTGDGRLVPPGRMPDY